jgi:hypothetical protein
MGACSFVSKGSGKTMKEAYQNLCESAIDFYGYQEGYNGTISTTGGYSDVTSRFKNSGKSLDDFISDRLDIIRKRDCEAICIEEPRGNTNKVKSQVKNIVTPGTKKWILKYVVLDAKGTTIGSKTTKGDAIKLARKYTEETQIKTYIEMVKVLEESSPKVAEIEYKKSTNERLGRYIFFGWAAE